MASSFYSNTQHIDFASVFSMNDPSMVSMFQALIASGLEGFLGCTTVVYETALVDFFENASVCDGVIISTVAGQLVEISEEWFAETFELPVDGLADVSEMPKDKIFDARSIVSMSGEPVILSGLKSQMKIHYRLLCDIMAKSISVKAGSFNAITKMVTSGTKQAKGFANLISLLLAIIPNLELGELSEFPSSKILTENTVHRYIAVIDKSGAQDADVAPKATKAPKKRTTAVPADVPVVKRKRTTKKKDSSSQDNLELVAVAEEAVPIQIIEVSTAPAADDTADQPATVDAFPADRPAEEIESVERVDEQLAAEPAVHVPAEEPAVEVSRVNVDDPETVIRQVLDQLDFVTEDPVVAKFDRVETWFDRAFDVELATADHEHHDAGTIDCGDQSVDKTNEVLWFVRPFILADRDTGKLFETACDSEDAMDLKVESQDLPVVRDTNVSTVGEQEITAFGEQLMGTNDESSEDIESEAVEKSADEAMSIDDIFMSIPAEVRLPSAGVEITKIILGKEIKIPGVNEKACFLATLPQIPADDKGKKLLIEKDPVKGNPVEEQKWAALQMEGFSAKVEQVLTWAGTDSTIVALQRKRYILLVYREIRKVLENRRKNFVPSETRDRGAVIARSNTNTRSSCWIRTMIRVNGTWVIEPCVDKWVKIPRQIISCEVHRQRQYDDTLPSVSEFFRIIKKRWADICLEVVAFCSSRRLLPVGSVNFCRGLPVGEPVFRVAPRQSPVFAFRVSQFCSVFVDFSLFSWLPTADITDFLSSIALDRTAFRDVQIAQERTILRNVQSSVLVAPSVQLSLDQRRYSHISSSDGDPTINFTSDDVQFQDRPADNMTSFPASSTDFSEAIDDLKTFLAQSIADSQNDILSKINIVAGRLREDLQHHENTSRAQVNNSCQDTRLHINGLIVNLESTKKGSEQLEFQAKIAADLLSLSTQIGDIVDYIRGGDAKKGEGSSHPLPTPVRVERRPLPTPQPPSDVQGSGQFLSVEQAVELVREADRRESDRLERERARERRERRLSISGLYKRRRGQ
ncbi:hypothetical protein F511_15033 [Dorcoceras hygrometricum]|uniref:Dystroglycan-like n=1 Tax=Dorcoceras hygrometricum TaxID=472368 RepID=A0A2Z7BXW5_9LAMI|nr:hypothetical protein F511_15033 [Dorcoceras hygrometricum]